MKKIKKVQRLKKVTKTDNWKDFPQKTFQEWFSEFVLAQLAVEFYGRNKTWPTKMDLSSLQIKENKDGSATLSLELQ
jgi:hypothetical protein